MRFTTCLILAMAASCVSSVSSVCAEEASSVAGELTKFGQLVQKLESLHLVMYGKDWMPGRDKVKAKCFSLWYASKDSCLRTEEVTERTLSGLLVNKDAAVTWMVHDRKMAQKAYLSPRKLFEIKEGPLNRELGLAGYILDGVNGYKGILSGFEVKRISADKDGDGLKWYALTPKPASSGPGPLPKGVDMRIGIDAKTGLVCAVKMQINKGGMEVQAVLVETNTPVANALKLPPYVVKAGVMEAATGMTVEWKE